MTSGCCVCKSANGVTVKVKLVATEVVSGMIVWVEGRTGWVPGMGTFVDSSASSLGSRGGEFVAVPDVPENVEAVWDASTNNMIPPPINDPIRNKAAGLLFKARNSTGFGGLLDSSRNLFRYGL